MFLGACRRRRRRGGFQLYQLRAAWGATGQLCGIRLGLWVSRFRGCRAKRLYLHIGLPPKGRFIADGPEARTRTRRISAAAPQTKPRDASPCFKRFCLPEAAVEAWKATVLLIAMLVLPKAAVLLMIALVLPKAKAPTARRCLIMLPRAKAPINRSAWKATVHQGRARVSRRGAWPSTFS